MPLLKRAKMVEGEGFEPSKHEAADLQSAGFDRSPTPPGLFVIINLEIC